MAISVSGQVNVIRVGKIAARYRGKLDDITIHPDGRTWAGTISNSLALIHLEG